MRCYNDDMHSALPGQVHVFVRDWLSSNNILLKSPDGHVLIDSGYVRHAPLTLALLRSRARVGQRTARQDRQHALPLRSHRRQRDDPARLWLPHCAAGRRGAADRALGHEGAVARLRRPADRSLYRGRNPSRGSTHVWGGLEWRAIAAPGHDMGALVFYNPEHRILISGDALWENGFGFVMPRASIPPRCRRRAPRWT